MTRHRQRAFSLVEALTATCLAATLLSLCLPAFQGLIQANRTQTTHDRLKSSLHLARAHSIGHGLNVELCGSSDGQTCDHAWHDGWLVRERASRKRLHSERLASQPHLAWRGLSKQIRFIPTGYANASNGTFTLCDGNGRALWQIVLNRQGRARTVKAEQLQSTACEAS